MVAANARSRRDWLQQAGQLVVGSGCLQSNRTGLALHTDYGTAAQDKETNQDYALAWTSDPAQDASGPILALALADGVTSSYRSEWAAELACAVAMQVLIENLRKPSATGANPPPPFDQARTAFTAAGHALQEMARKLENSPEASCPQGQYLSTWKYIHRKGALLQTTLTLAWVQHDMFRLAMIGDGGVLWRATGVISTAAPVDEMLAKADLNTNEVNVLGPRSPAPKTFDLWFEKPWLGHLVCALYSDGIGRGVEKAGLNLLQCLSAQPNPPDGNPARSFIRQIVEANHPSFDDNLTLALLRRD